MAAQLPKKLPDTVQKFRCGESNPGLLCTTLEHVKDSNVSHYTTSDYIRVGVELISTPLVAITQ